MGARQGVSIPALNPDFLLYAQFYPRYGPCLPHFYPVFAQSRRIRPLMRRKLVADFSFVSPHFLPHRPAGNLPPSLFPAVGAC